MAPPELSLYDHQQSLTLDLPRLTGVAERAWPLVIAAPGPEVPVLPDLREVEVSFITDEAIAKVHAEFLEDPTPTDVITFAPAGGGARADSGAGSGALFDPWPAPPEWARGRNRNRFRDDEAVAGRDFGFGLA